MCQYNMIPFPVFLAFFFSFPSIISRSPVCWQAQERSSRLLFRKVSSERAVASLAALSLLAGPESFTAQSCGLPLVGRNRQSEEGTCPGLPEMPPIMHAASGFAVWWLTFQKFWLGMETYSNFIPYILSGLYLDVLFSGLKS